MTFAPAPLDASLGAPVQAAAQLDGERAAKQARLAAVLQSQGLDAILLRRNENLAWISAGAIDRRVLLPAETGVPTLLVRRDGRRFYLTTNNEAARLADEEFASLDYEAVVTPWQSGATASELEKLAGRGRIGADTHAPGTSLVNLANLRAPLTELEMARYRWLGAQTAAAATAVALSLVPGVSEVEINARTAYELWRRRIEPSVMLMAVDHRILRYKHALSHNARLQRYGMVNLCARKWGLAVSVTRFVHFGSLPAELAQRFQAAAQVNAALLHATREGATSAELYAAAARAYAEAGFPGEEAKHHQGGATGYLEREWVATPSGTETVAAAQAFAWNPSIQGGKVEDTVLLREGRIEMLTPTPDFPVMETAVGDASYRSSGVLIR